MKRIILTISVAALLMVGGFAAAGLSAPPPDNPGSPGDNCSHGNSGAPCRPDPSPNGKDCQDHGRARGNEDHCDGGETTPPPTTTEPPPTTTVPPTTTTEVPPSTPQEPPSTTTVPSPSNPVPPASQPAPSATTPQTPGSVGSQPVTSRSLKAALQKQAPSQSSGGVAAPQAAATELPHTGLPLGAWVALGCGLVGTGLGLRRRRV